jgi:peptidoglycan/xylan/chitin deacetylase (PgdA/CDA1 family)
MPGRPANRWPTPGGPRVAHNRRVRGRFVISLDFELHWGVRDQRSIDSYRANLLGVREVVPRLLELFGRRGIRATWATVGFLMAEDKDELLHYAPAERPHYADARLDPYAELGSIGQDEKSDPYHYAPSLVSRIAQAPGQELATHTFSHFYALESGALDEAFRADLAAALELARARGLSLTSIVFPRNQVGRSALHICRELGLTAFRGTEHAWYQRPRSGTGAPPARAVRLLDAYVPLGTHHVQRPHEVEGMVNIAQSRFLRSWRPSPVRLDALRLARIVGAMATAARTGRIFHLWWHPHGFGAEPSENLAFLERILAGYGRLRDSLEFESMTMGEVADEYRAALEV